MLKILSAKEYFYVFIVSYFSSFCNKRTKKEHFLTNSGYFLPAKKSIFAST